MTRGSKPLRTVRRPCPGVDAGAPEQVRGREADEHRMERMTLDVRAASHASAACKRTTIGLVERPRAELVQSLRRSDATMRIALIGPPFIEIPPHRYGGTE